jgi:hypothetical protein
MSWPPVPDLGTISSMSRRRYVCRGVEGGWRVYDNKTQRFWGDHYETQPDALVAELNGAHRPEVIAALTRDARKTKR